MDKPESLLMENQAVYQQSLNLQKLHLHLMMNLFYLLVMVKF